MKHLPRRQALGFGLVGLDCLNGARLVSPSVVDQKLGIHAEKLIQERFVASFEHTADGATCHVAHRKHSVGFKRSCIALANAPEVGQGTVIPKLLAVGDLVKLCNSYAVLVCGHLLCHNVHCNLGKIQIGSDTNRGGNSRCRQHVADEHTCKLMPCHSSGFEIARCINEHFINRVNVDILGGYVLEIDLIDPRAVLHIVRHTRRRNDIGHGKRRICFQLVDIIRLTHELACLAPALVVYFFHLLNDLKQPRATGDAEGFQGGRNGKSYGLLCPSLVGNHQIGRHRIELALNALNGGIERLQIDCNIYFI